MKLKLLVSLAGLICLRAADAQVSFEKIDTTMKIAKTGYRLNCRNKDIAQNQLSIRPIGFESPANENMNFPVRGRIAKAMVDDLNQDGVADLILFIYSDSAAIHGTVLAFISDGTKSIVPAGLPDVALDGKLNTGYKGHDHFSMLEGTLLQRFPIFKPADKDTPTGGSRVIQYQLSKVEGGGYKFAVLRSYDTH
ncbi:MAG TPA: hypothetical protein VHE54_13495 [Puia sp.]|nr:hypothetical protein [Puia sp.]